jgi:Predicted membrane protein (DUF2142)
VTPPGSPAAPETGGPAQIALLPRTGAPEGTARAGRSRFFVTFVCWWVLLAGLGSLWVLATPIGASPDAPSQVPRAASVVRGQWVGPTVPGTGSAVTTYVRVPKTYLDPGPMSRCYMFKENVSAACAPAPVQSSQVVRTETHVGRYPPVYYLAVGWPSLLTSAVAGLYFMQGASVALGTAFLALAVAAARRWSSSPLMVPAIAIGVTPMALFMTSSVNPNGLEIDAAIALWATATVLVGEHLSNPPKGLLAALAVATGAMVWARPTALVWPLVVFVVLLPAAWKRAEARALLSCKVIVSCSTIAVLGVGALLWAVIARASGVLTNFGPLPASSSLGHVATFVIGRLPSLLQQGVGNFGWLDTPVPWFTLAAWVSLCLVAVAAAVVFSPRRMLISLLLSLVASFVVPVVLMVVAAPSYGFVGQGRYFLAIWVGVPIVAAGLVKWDPHSARARLLITTMGLLIASGQAAAYYWALRRYIVGIPGPLVWRANSSPRLKPPEWHPPIPGWWLVGIFTALCVVYGFAIRHPPSGQLSRERQRDIEPLLEPRRAG